MGAACGGGATMVRGRGWRRTGLGRGGGVPRGAARLGADAEAEAEAGLAAAVCAGGRSPARARRWPRGRPGRPGPAWTGGLLSAAARPRRQRLRLAAGGDGPGWGEAGWGGVGGPGRSRSRARARARRPPLGSGGAEVRAGPVVSAVTVRAAVKAARGPPLRRVSASHCFTGFNRVCVWGRGGRRCFYWGTAAVLAVRV